MPMKPPKPCRMPMCAELTHDRYCPKHKAEAAKALTWRKHTDPKLAKDDAWYSTPEWRALRMAQLREFPFCNYCGSVAEMVDHRTPINLGGSRRDRSNLQSLCNPCHNKKRQKESLAARR